jgi:hypothetical protein
MDNSQGEIARKDVHYPNGLNTTSMASSLLPANNASLKPFGSVSYLSDPLPTLLFDDADGLEDMNNGDESPITLNRDILRWADANPSSPFTISTSGSATNIYSTNHKAATERLSCGFPTAHNEGVHGNALLTAQQSQTDVSRGNTLHEAETWPPSDKVGAERLQLPVTNHPVSMSSSSTLR